MTLEDEIQELLERTRQATEAGLEYALAGKPVTLPPDKALMYALDMIRALEEAVRRLAREIEESRG